MSKSNVSVGYQAWVDQINAAYDECVSSLLEYRAKSVEAIIRTGQLLNDCKANVGHGAFLNIFEVKQLKIDERTAQRFMAIAKDRRLSNPTNLSLLPAVVDTLHKLTKLDDDTFEQANKDGIITPKMRAKDVPKPRKESPQGDAVPAVGERAPDSRPEANQEPPQTVAKGEDSAVIYEDMPATFEEVSPFHNPSWRFADGLMQAMCASRELDPLDAAEEWPTAIPLLSEELSLFADWMLDFEAAFRKRHGNGNDAALQSAVAE